jgi:hypothetical protein
MYSTQYGTFWKERTCGSCGCIYQGKISQLPETALSQYQSMETRVRNADSALLKQPCPGCGAKHPITVAKIRLVMHMVILVVGLIASVVLAVMTGTKRIDQTNFTIAAGAIGGGILLLHLLAWMWKPKAELQDEEWMQARQNNFHGNDIQVVHGPQQRPIGEKYPRWFLLSFPCMMLCALAPASAYPLLFVESPPNIEQSVNVKPIVIAGDRNVKVSWAGGFSSVNGLYRTKTGRVTIRNAAKLGLPNLIVYKLHQDDWSGRTIHTAKDGTDYKPEVVVEIDIPKMPEAVGQTLELEAEIDVEYPVRSGQKEFLVRTMKYKKEFNVKVASEEEVAKVVSFNTAGFWAMGGNTIGAFAGLLLALGAAGRISSKDDGTLRLG